MIKYVRLIPAKLYNKFKNKTFKADEDICSLEGGKKLRYVSKSIQRAAVEIVEIK